jgi:hypothetical protein
MAGAADVSSQWNGGTGDWIEPLNWTHSPANVGAEYPGNGLLTYDVHFGGGEAIFPIASEFQINTLWMSGGTLSGHTTLTLNEGFHTSGPEVSLDLTQINMMGTSRWDAAVVTIGQAADRIINYGVQELSDVQISLLFNDRDAYENHGLLRKATGTGTARIIGERDGQFYNDGTIACTSGTLSFAVWGDIRGHIEAATNAEVRFVLSAAIMRFVRPTFSGEGSIVFERGPVSMDLAVTNATTMVFEDASVGSGATFYNQSNGVLRLRARSLGGSSQIAAGLINHGQVLLEGPETGFGWGNTIVNHGLLRYEDLGDTGFGGHNYSIHNHGVLQFSNTTIEVQVPENDGTIRVSGGTLTLWSPGTNFGTLDTSSNGTVAWYAGYTLGSGARLQGNLSAFSDTFVTGDSTNHGFLDLHAELSGPGNLCIANGGTLIWDANMAGPGATIVQPGGSVVPGASAGRLSGGTIINESGNSLRWDTGGNLALDSGKILNRGSLAIGHSMTIHRLQSGPAALHNEGTFTIRSTNGPVNLFVALTNTGAIVIDSSTLEFGGTYVQNSGSTSIEGGNMWAPSYDVYVLGGTFSVNGMLDCGVLDLRSTLSLSSTGFVSASGLQLSDSSVVEFEIGPGGSGAVSIRGAEWAPVKGTLRLRLTEGFVPTVGTRYTLFTRVVPMFDALRFEGLEMGGGLRLAPYYDGELAVVVMNAPQSGQKALTLTRLPLGQFQLSWPPEFAGFYLQYTTNLSEPIWTTADLTWTNSDLSIWSSDPKQFFRLMQP